jgi:hypothetical protein
MHVSKDRKRGTVANTLAIVSREDTLRRIRGEYLEMPGLCLTHAQAQRLWGLDAPTCASLLTALTADKFLFLRQDGTYGRLSDCAASYPPALRNTSHRAAKSFRYS